MGGNKGRGIKGRNYDELSGVGTSRGGITGTTGNLNSARHDGGIGTPDPGDAGNLQSASHGQPGGTPALGRGGRGGGVRQRQGLRTRDAADTSGDTGTGNRQGPDEAG